ncbi:unnamed protein product [Orchesella dallaii]|uniref:Enoyl-CoA hydratase n=1 Tax=Orchesella dallaii TaxID=48710 RepID=A0ABP1QQW9_9HEXA
MRLKLAVHGTLLCRKTNIPLYNGTFALRKMSSLPQGSYKNLVVDKVKNITTIGINRPEKRNCVNLQTAKELQEAFKEFENDSSTTAAVLYGKGGHFSAGLDLKEISEFPNDFNFLETGNYCPKSSEGVGPMGPSRRIFAKPVIAAVSGYAVAGGMEIALMCDLRVVEETATFGIFCRRFGVPLIDGGTIRLPHLIGLSRAMDLIVTGRPVKGKEALHIGLANRLVPTGSSLNEAVKLAEEISNFPQECMNTDRKSAYAAMFSSQSFEESIQREMAEGLKVLHKESIQGAGKFASGIGRHGKFESQ